MALRPPRTIRCGVIRPLSARAPLIAITNLRSTIRNSPGMPGRIREEIPIQTGPIVHLAERPCVQPIEPLPSSLPHTYETGGSKSLQVLRDGRLRHTEGPCEARDGVFGRPKLVEEGAPARVGLRRGKHRETESQTRADSHKRVLIGQPSRQGLCKL